MLLTRNTCKKRFVTLEFKRDEKDANGDEIYLWYNEIAKFWLLSSGSDFQARNYRCCMYINSRGQQDLWIRLQWILIFLIQIIEKIIFKRLMSRNLEPNGKNSLTVNGRRLRRSRYHEWFWRKRPTFDLENLVSTTRGISKIDQKFFFQLRPNSDTVLSFDSEHTSLKAQFGRSGCQKGVWSIIIIYRSPIWYM